MKVGYLGTGNTNNDVAFEVSSSLIETFDNMKVNKSVSYTIHKIHGKKAVPEMTGIETDTVTFDILLSAYLGVNPKKELEKLEGLMSTGTICNLVLGSSSFGTWLIKSMPYNVEYVYKEGDIIQAKATISLIEASVNYGGEVVKPKTQQSATPAATTTTTTAAQNEANRIKSLQQQAAARQQMIQENIRLKQEMLKKQQEQMMARIRQQTGR